MKNINMKIQLGYILSMLILAGCNTPDPFQLVDETNDSKLIDMKTVGIEPDSLFVGSGVDTSGVPGWGSQRYLGRMVFTNIRYGLIDSSSKNFEQAEAVFLDSSRPILHNGNIMAYPSYNVGILCINSDTLSKIERKIRTPMAMIDTVIGYRYQLRKDYSSTPGLTYQWNASGSGGVSSFNFEITAPPELRVTGILPPYVSVPEPLHFKWLCSNPIINIIISREGLLQQRTWVPVLHLRIRNVKGEITIPSKILELLPKRFDRFMFTFSSDRRITKPAGAAGGYPYEVLLEAVSIHNILLNVHRQP